MPKEPSPNGAQTQKSSLAAYLDAKEKGLLPEPISNNDDQLLDEDEAPTPPKKPNGHANEEEEEEVRKPCPTCKTEMLRAYSKETECATCQRKTLRRIQTPEEFLCATCGQPKEFEKATNCFKCSRRNAYDFLHKIDQWASAHPDEMRAHARLIATANAALAFPEESMYGRFAQLARDMEMPLGYAYPALLAVASYLPEVSTMLGVRLPLYTVIIAPVGGGKNTAIVRAIETFGLTKGSDWKVTTASSDRGLMQILGSKTTGRGANKKTEPGPSRILLRSNEMGATLKKAAIEGSVLSDMLCELWDTGQWECSDKTGTQECDCRMSWLGGVPVPQDDPEEFAAAFSKFASYGLMSRLILGYSTIPFKHDGKEWRPKSRVTEETFDYTNPAAFVRTSATIVRRMEPVAQELYDAWHHPQDRDGRMKFNLHKIAIITASANGEESVTAECMRCAILFMNWQGELRTVFRPSEAIGTPESILGEIIMRKFRKLPYGKAILWKDVAHDMKWKKYGASLLNRTIEALVNIGELDWAVTEKNGMEKSDHKRVLVVWKNEDEQDIEGKSYEF
jgi:hypothetical protein